MKTNDKYGGKLSLLPLSLLVVEPLVKSVYGQAYFLLPYLYGIVGLLAAWYGYRYREHIRVTWADLVAVVLMVYNLPAIISNGQIIVFTVCTSIYLWARLYSTPAILNRWLVIAGCCQSVIAWLQWGEILPSHHNYFVVTGSFDNPGPLGGFLAICFLACIGQYHRMPLWLGGISITLLVSGVALAESRAAWLGIFIGVIYLIMVRRHICLWRQIGIMTVVCCAFGLLCYMGKQSDSVRGRLVVWTVCTNMWLDQPLNGHGTTTFPQKYMDYQTDYIQTGASEDAIRLMGNNRYAFNEFIHIGCTQGLIGVLLVLVWLALLFRQPLHREYLSSQTCLLAYLTFACFSYPLDVCLLQIPLAAILGCLSRDVPTVFIVSIRPIKHLVTCFLLCGIGIIGHKGIYEIHFRQAFNRFFYHNDRESLAYMEQHLPAFQHREVLISEYARMLCLKEEYQAAIPALQASISLFPTTDKYVDLGDAYRAQALYQEAETAYSHATNMLPYLIYPHYCLFMLYRETGQTKKAVRKAQEIQHLTPKAGERRAEEMKSHARNYLSSP